MHSNAIWNILEQTWVNCPATNQLQLKQLSIEFSEFWFPVLKSLNPIKDHWMLLPPPKSLQGSIRLGRRLRLWHDVYVQYIGSKGWEFLPCESLLNGFLSMFVDLWTKRSTGFGRLARPKCLLGARVPGSFLSGLIVPSWVVPPVQRIHHCWSWGFRQWEQSVRKIRTCQQR